MNQTNLIDNPVYFLDNTAMIVGRLFAGTETFLPLFEQHIDDFSIKKPFYPVGFHHAVRVYQVYLALRGGL